jgi:hypothetical protein
MKRTKLILSGVAAGLVMMSMSPADHAAAATATVVDLHGGTVSVPAGAFRQLKDGMNLTIENGTIIGGGAEVVFDAVPDGGHASVTLSNLTVAGPRALVFAKRQGGPVDITVDHVNASHLGDGIRATADAVLVTSSTLTGGAKPPSGNAAGVHSLDDDAGNVGLPQATVTVLDSTVEGFTGGSAGGFLEGDAVVGEARVGHLDVERDTLGHVPDAEVDSKAEQATVKDNVLYSDGDRAISSHRGVLTASGNTITQAPVYHAKIYQGSGTLHASGDVVLGLDKADQFLAYANSVCCPGSGPAASYPRVGDVEVTDIVDGSGAVLTGPAHQEGGATVRVSP